MKIKVSLRTINVCLLVLCVAGGVSRFSIGVHAQKQDKTKTAHPTAPPKPDSNANTTANNAAYAAKVKEYTTESYFMTELVDHLPASDKVPSPDKVIGYDHLCTLERLGEEFVVPGPRVSGATEKLARTLHPEAFR